MLNCKNHHLFKMFFVISGNRINRQHQPHHTLQPGARLQQILWEEGEREAQ